MGGFRQALRGWRRRASALACRRGRDVRADARGRAIPIAWPSFRLRPRSVTSKELLVAGAVSAGLCAMGRTANVFSEDCVAHCVASGRPEKCILREGEHCSPAEGGKACWCAEGGGNSNLIKGGAMPTWIADRRAGRGTGGWYRGEGGGVQGFGMHRLCTEPMYPPPPPCNLPPPCNAPNPPMGGNRHLAPKA